MSATRQAVSLNRFYAINIRRIPERQVKHMNELKIFQNPEFGAVRTIIIDDEVWFVGNDVARALGY